MRKTTWRNAILSLLITFFAIPTAYSQYLHRNSQKIVDASGQEYILRGMGLGGWMLQEGYMLETSNFANAQYQIRAKIQDLIGEANTNEFYNAWLANHCTKRDIDSLASWGFNSVRLPMHYNLYTLPIEKEPVPGQNTWLEKGFAMTDSLVKWCAANNMYVILDLHAAPGGQGNDIAISDNDTSKPSLWASAENQQKTIALWRKLAERYADEKWIGGYDLINETNYNFVGANKNGCDETVNAPLKKLLTDITTAIREVDQHHIIFIEGNCWANNHNGLLPLWDENMAVSFHKYWNYNDQGSVQGFINMRSQYNVPIWLGETGENSNVWFRNAVRLMEDNKIGWAWWPLKKVGSVVNPLTVVKNDGYNQLLNYWTNGGTKPSVDVAKAALMQLAENLKIENNIYRKDVIDAMFRQVSDDTTIPYSKHNIPGVVHASDFDLGRSQHAYADKDTANYQVSAGTYTAWNSGWTYRNDGVDIEANQDADDASNGYDVGWTNDDEWLQYTLEVDSTAAYNVTVRYASTAATKIKLLVNGNDQTSDIELTLTGAFNTWSSRVVNDVMLYKGTQKLKLYFVKGGANISFLKFSLSKKSTEVGLKALGAETEQDAQRVRVSLNKKVDRTTLTKTGFKVKVNSAEVAILEVNPADDDNSILIKLDKTLQQSETIKIDYNSDAIKSTDGTLLEDFTDLQARNSLPVYFAIPTTIEAEDFDVNNGLQLESTTDTGGGQDIGYTNTGDYLDYLMRVTDAGEYKIDVRVACNADAGKLEFQQLGADGTVLHSTQLDVPVTGGWQSWTTVSTTMTLDAGTGTLRAKIIKPEFNINWFKFSYELIDGINEKKVGSVMRIYPNPAERVVHVEIPENIYKKENILCIRQLNGRVVKRLRSASTREMESISIDGLASGMYLLEFEVKGQLLSDKFLIK
jgi:endoglucanase